MKRRLTAVYFLGMVVEIIVRTPYERQRNQIQKTDQRVSLAERGLLSWMTLGMFALPLAYGLSKWLDFANYRLAPTTKKLAGGLGTGLLSAAVWMLWRGHRDLGANWSPSLEITTQQTLITEGVYRTIRHPMYTSQLLWGFAQALLLQNWLSGLGGLVAFLFLYFVRVPNEEQMMLDHFGDDYRAYCERTGRVLPRLWGKG